MSPRCPRTTLAAAALLAAACTTEQPTEPDLARGGTAQFAAAPGALDLTWPSGASAVVTVTVQYLTTVSAASSNTGCATVSPASTPTRKPKGSSSYVATFTVSAAGVGTCTINLADKNGKSAAVQVTVTEVLPDRIAYISDVNGGSDLWIMDLDGSNPTQLTATPDEHDIHASLSADGRRVLFIASTNDVWVPTLIGVDGTGRTSLQLAGLVGPPTLSPDGRRVAYVGLVDSRSRIFTADLDGGNATQLTFGTTAPTEGSPWWSGAAPGRILFTREAPRNLWVMNPDGSGQVQITADDDPWKHGSIVGALSPDGQWVAWECQPTTHIQNICKIKTDGTGRVQLTDSEFGDRAPRWTRDGRIVFTSRRDGNREIYIMNADGSGQTNLSNSPANEATGFGF